MYPVPGYQDLSEEFHHRSYLLKKTVWDKELWLFLSGFNSQGGFFYGAQIEQYSLKISSPHRLQGNKLILNGITMWDSRIAERW